MFFVLYGCQPDDLHPTRPTARGYRVEVLLIHISVNLSVDTSLTLRI